MSIKDAKINSNAICGLNNKLWAKFKLKLKKKNRKSNRQMIITDTKRYQPASEDIPTLRLEGKKWIRVPLFIARNLFTIKRNTLLARTHSVLSKKEDS